jgi:hypothetical protein
MRIILEICTSDPQGAHRGDQDNLYDMHVKRVGGISYRAPEPDELDKLDDGRFGRRPWLDVSDGPPCPYCRGPLTGYTEKRDGTHDECQYAAAVIANPPRDVLRWERAVSRLRISDCEKPKLYRFRWPSFEESKLAASTKKDDVISDRCSCSGGHTPTCRKRKSRRRIAEERCAAGMTAAPRGRPCKPGGPRRGWASAWLAPWQVVWIRNHGLSIADYMLIVEICAMWDDPLERVARFAGLLARYAQRGNTNAAQLVTWLRSSVLTSSKESVA